MRTCVSYTNYIIFETKRYANIGSGWEERCNTKTLIIDGTHTLLGDVLDGGVHTVIRSVEGRGEGSKVGCYVGI